MAHGAKLAVAVTFLLVGAAEARLRPVPGASPTNGQEVRSDLSDPGLDGVIRVRARLPARRVRLLLEDAEEEPLLLLRRHDLADVPFAWSYDPVGEVLEVRPGLPLPAAQFTLDVRARLLGRRPVVRGRNRDFSTSFCVGPDVFAPVLLATRPARERLDVRRRAPVVATFSESLDPESVILGETVFVENLSVYPPVPVPGRVLLDRQGFDLVFRADAGLPAASIIGVRLPCAGSPNHVRDLVGNGLPGNADPLNQVTFHFSTGMR